jgi:hypothetical protein
MKTWLGTEAVTKTEFTEKSNQYFHMRLRCISEQITFKLSACYLKDRMIYTRICNNETFSLILECVCIANY